jgi:hypothetical protein
MKFLLKLIGCLFFQVLINSSLHASDDELLAILKTYNDNQARFHLNHKGKIFKGEGIVWEILVDPSRTGKYFMVDIRILSNSLISKSVRDAFDPSRVRCVVFDMKLASSLEKFKIINVSGVINDVKFDNIIILKDCNFNK